MITPYFIVVVILYIVLFAVLFYLIAVALVKLRSSIYASESERAFGRIQLFLITIQFIALATSYLVYHRDPFMLDSTGEAGGGYLATNPNVRIPLMISMLVYLLSAFPKSSFSKGIRRRATLSLLAMVVFYFASYVSQSFYNLIIYINPSGWSGIVLFSFYAYVLLIFTVTRFKTTGLSRVQKSASLLYLPLCLLLVWIYYVHKLSDQEYEYYFKKLGGYG